MTIVLLKDLEVGDMFMKPPKATGRSNRTIFTVRGNPFFNARHGSATRFCHNNKTKQLVSKSCRQEVIKVGESKFKEQYKSTPIKK
ncbi:MAG: hypothetical protein J7527_01705 [Chitinophagaceae bacterium]|nr:hypothetical protein [Chitinophagaceae bacterium]